MCGIIGYVGNGSATEMLLTGLENLEYRGYDSAGLALTNGSGLEVRKREGEVSTLEAVTTGNLDGHVGVGHTRWSTHGPPSDANAHPHTSCNEDVAVVHNGIIDNYDRLREDLTHRGHTFTSETDTEVIPHLVEEYLTGGADPETAFRRAVADLKGSYAIAMVVSETDTLYATRSGSPLVLGVGDGAYYLASDVPAFLEFTDEVVYLEDGDIAIVDGAGYRVTTGDGHRVDRGRETVDWSPRDAEKGGYDHYMLKEIHEQPAALDRTIRGRVDEPTDPIGDEIAASVTTGVQSVQFVACGTSYHAALYGEQLLASRGIQSDTMLASEFVATAPPLEDGTLVVGVTQSGETADTLEALRTARNHGHRTLAITNVVGSTAARECDDALFIRAGPEIGVAATKTFSSQVATLAVFATHLAGEVEASFLRSLGEIPERIRGMLDDETPKHIADRFQGAEAYFFIGRGVAHPVALEAALKLKEISYEHAEGFPAGELKHGPLALVTPETPIFAVVTGENEDKMRGTIEEVAARGAPIVALAPPSVDLAGDIERLPIPETHPQLAGILANVQLQLVAYHTADILDRPVDKPRNLAKSVTVE